MKNHTTQHLHYDDTFGDCTYSFHISVIVLEIAHIVLTAQHLWQHILFFTFVDCTYNFHIEQCSFHFTFHFFLQFNSLPFLIVTAPKWNDTLTWLQFSVSTYLQFFSVFLGEIGFKLQLTLYKETKKLSKEFFKFKLQPAWHFPTQCLL